MGFKWNFTPVHQFSFRLTSRWKFSHLWHKLLANYLFKNLATFAYLVLQILFMLRIWSFHEKALLAKKVQERWNLFFFLYILTVITQIVLWTANYNQALDQVNNFFSCCLFLRSFIRVSFNFVRYRDPGIPGGYLPVCLLYNRKM